MLWSVIFATLFANAFSLRIPLQNGLPSTVIIRQRSNYCSGQLLNPRVLVASSNCNMDYGDTKDVLLFAKNIWDYEELNEVANTMVIDELVFHTLLWPIKSNLVKWISLATRISGESEPVLAFGFTNPSTDNITMLTETLAHKDKCGFDDDNYLCTTNGYLGSAGDCLMNESGILGILLHTDSSCSSTHPYINFQYYEELIKNILRSNGGF